MRRISILSLITILAVFRPASASTAPQEPNPSGPYQQTCSEISVKKGDLYAKCQDEKGQGHSTKLSSYQKCGSEIVNKNGNLECAATSGHAAPALPSGPYTESCKDIQMRGTTLHAVCRSYDGTERPVSLKDANRCNEGVANINGVLNCVVSDVLPPGSYLATCKEVHWQGTTLNAICKNAKDEWLPAQLHDGHKCTGDIANQSGTLRCVESKHKK